jgi:hypothetical protein
MLSNENGTTVAANLVRNSPLRVSPSPPTYHKQTSSSGAEERVTVNIYP